MTSRVTRIPLASPAPGTQRHLTVRRYGEPGARPKAYLQASIHADELPAMLVAHHLSRLLDEAAADGRISGEIVLVPVANPIGITNPRETTLLWERATGRPVVCINRISWICTLNSSNTN